ncbi:MAG: VTC domain-containing protein [Gemmatimonadota bacterium]|nr:VTC domain-containing protein [Gemmatimonadota bacterium]
MTGAPAAPGRLEYKFLLPGLTDQRAVDGVTARVAGLRRTFPPRQVSSLYFDSASYVAYAGSNAGNSERVKVRLRWYGALADSSPLTLELKHRANHHGWKSVYPEVPGGLASVPLRQLASRFANHVAPRHRLTVELLRLPIVLTSYRREYFTDLSGAVRVTVDTGLRFLDQRHHRCLNLRSDQVETSFSVVECKFQPERRADAVRLLRAFGPRQVRFSKYCFGLEHLRRR